ncbi:MAG: VWA domain-containing protein [Candidatus Hodarchaeota archaeon]
MSNELNLFVETAENLGDEIFISNISAQQLGIKDGDLVVVSIPEEGFRTTIPARINETLFDFVVQIDENLPEILGFKAMELTVSPVTEGAAARPAAPSIASAPAPPAPVPPSSAGIPAPPSIPKPPGMAPPVPGAAPSVPQPPGMMGGPPVPGVPKVPAVPGVPAVPKVPAVPGVPAVPKVPAVPGVPAMPKVPAPPVAGPPVPAPPAAGPPVPAPPAAGPPVPAPPAAGPPVPAPPAAGPPVPAPPAAGPPVPAPPAAGPPAPAPAPEEPEYDIVTETQWELIPSQNDDYGTLIVDETGNALYGMDDQGYPLDSYGNAFMNAQFNEVTVEKKVPKEKKKMKKVQVLVPNQVDAYGMEIVDSNNNPVYGMDSSGWYAMDSTGQPFESSQWMEIEVEEEEEKPMGPYPPNMMDDFGQKVVDEYGFAIYGEDEYSQPLDPNGVGVWWEGSTRPKYPDMIDISQLAQQTNGMILTPKIDNKLTDHVLISPANVDALGLYDGMMVEWQDHKTRGTGASRIRTAQVPNNEVHMSQDAYDAAEIVERDDVVLYSAEAPIEKVDVMEVNVELADEFEGKCAISPRLSLSLDLGGRSGNEIMAFEDPLTGAFGAAKVVLDEYLPENSIKIDSEIYEASGIGADTVEIKINKRKIIPLQEATIGINPLEGDQVWEVLSKARRFIGQLKSWLSNFIVFKDLKLRWKTSNAAIKILNSTPDLSGDVLAEVKPTTNILLKPEGLVTFNAILIIDISRSMMARDLEVKQIGPAIEGIKAAMASKEIQNFLKQFKEGTNVPRRIGAAFAAILFLAEKVGRGFGEKVSIVRFADTAEALQFDGTPFMEGSSGAKDVLERTAINIVNNIGNAYGQATNMGQAMLIAQELIYQMQDMEGGDPDMAKPVMVILLTDGYPTDGDNFNVAVQELAKNQNVVFYILGLGSPNVEMMTKAAAMCGGEFYMPEDAGKLLIWYSKRARDLQVKLKSHKTKSEEEEEEGM